MYIVRQVRGQEGIVNAFTFMPRGSLLKECADFITVHCRMSEFIDVPSGRMNMVVELGAPGFRRYTGRPSFMLGLVSTADGIQLHYPESHAGMSDADFRKMVGLDDDREWDEFRSELAEDVFAACEHMGFANKNFRIRVIYVRGEPRKIRFRPKSMIADYLMEVGIDLDLSGFIDLENRPKKKGRDNEPIEVYLAQLRKELRAKGWSEAEIEAEVERQSTVAQFDIMLSLYYTTCGQFFPLAMYTSASGKVKFWNGTVSNKYQQDLVGTVRVPPEKLKDFMENLHGEVLAVLHEMGIKYLSNSVFDLGLDEPWADSVRDIDMETISKLRKKPTKPTKPTKKTSKKVAI